PGATTRASWPTDPRAWVELTAPPESPPASLGGMEDLSPARYLAIRDRGDEPARAAGRDPGEVRLLPVSKTVPAERLRREWPGLRDAGCVTLAENRVQEAAAKAGEVPGPRWAVIGPLQTNKAGQLATFADEFQALDRPKVAAALQRRLADARRTPDAPTPR